MNSPGRPWAGSIHFFLGRINGRTSDFRGDGTKARKAQGINRTTMPLIQLQNTTDTHRYYKSSTSMLRISQESPDRSRSVKSPTIHLGQSEYLMRSMSQMDVVFSRISGRIFTDLDWTQMGKQRVLVRSRLQRLPTQRLFASI